MKKSFLDRFFPPLLLIAAVFLLYFKTLFYGFTYLDDHVWILDHQWFIKDISNIGSIFLKPDLLSKIFYRPILSLSFMLDAQLGGEAPFVYHLTNVVLHLLNACLLFILLQKLGYKAKLAFCFSLIFSVHPALTSAVAWIPGRTDSLLATFVLSSFIFFLKFLDSEKRLYLWGHFILFVLALLTKETAIVLPLVCYFYLILVAGKDKKPGNPKALHLPWIFIIVVWLLVRKIILIQSREIPLSFAFRSIIENASALVTYAGKAILPVNCSVLPIVEDMTLLYGIIGILLLFFLVGVSKERKGGMVVWGILWFILFLLPALVLSFLKHEYRLYLPLIGIGIVVCETDLVKKIAAQRNQLAVVTLCIAGIFSLITFFNSGSYKDRLIFWRRAVVSSPHSPLAHRNLGAMYYLDKRVEEAKREFERSLALNPLEPMVHNNLGLIYAGKGLLGEAEREYKREVEINPTYPNVYYNLGLLYFHQGKTEAALEAWEKTIELDPKYIAAYKNLAATYFTQMEFHKASFYYRHLADRGIDIPEDVRKALKIN